MFNSGYKRYDLRNKFSVLSRWMNHPRWCKRDRKFAFYLFHCGWHEIQFRVEGAGEGRRFTGR